jgi:S1-C subfamily serine protease
MLGGMLSAALVAGVAGGAAGSAITASALGRNGSQSPAAAAAPEIVRTSAVAALPDNGIKGIYKQVAPAVVSVQTASAVARGTRPNTPGRTPGQQTPPSPQDPLLPNGEGSGFIVDPDGYILTNQHVVDGATRVSVVLQDGTRVTADLVGADPASDLALLKASLPAGRGGVAALGDSDAVEPGDTAIAIGTPFGLDHTITAGIVSAVDRDFGTAAGRPMRGLIQTDAPINPGNSGGPLLNANGEVIGITTSIESPVRGSVGIGFAIPINAAKRLLPQLRNGQSVQHAWLGISGLELTTELAAQAGLPDSLAQGVLIIAVQPDSPAARAGLRGSSQDGSGVPRGGDVILAIDGQEIKRVQDVAGYLDGKRPGDTVTLTLWRNGARQDVKATLAAWPASGGQ